MANSDLKKPQLRPKSPPPGKALPLVDPLVLEESLRPKKRQPVEIPELTLKDVLGSFLKWSATDIDVEHLVSGLPIKDGVLTEELMPRALDRFGFDAVLIQHRKVKRLTFPCCIALSTGGYVIALAQKGDAVQLLDFNQAECILEVPLETIQKLYSGRAFQLNPSVDLLLEKHSSGSEKKHWFWGRILLHKSRLFEVILATAFANVLAVVTSLFALQVYDRVIPGQSEATLWVLASGAGLAILFEGILRISRARLVDHIGKEAEIEISSDIFERMIAMKLDKRPAPPGAIVHMVREFSAVKEFFTNVAVGVVADLPFAVVFLLLIYGIAGHVVWIIVFGAVLIVLPNVAFQGRMARLSKETMGGMSSASRLLTEVSYGLETVKANKAESLFQGRWEEIIALNALKTTEQRSLRAFLTYWATSVQQATYIFAVIACVYAVFAGDLSTGAIIAIGILTTRTLSPISQLSQALSSWQNMKVSLSALETIITSEQDHDRQRTYIRRPVFEGNLSLQMVKFSHPGTKTVAVDVPKIELKRGMRLALLGANGSGKSTLLKVAAGLYQPLSGDVLIDGLDIRQIDPVNVRANIGYMSQEIQMFQGTLRENLACGSFKYSDDKLFEALDFGGLGTFAKHHPEGLDLKIGDGGGGLSIGQKQSIGLARLFLQDPAIILMDEPTSAFDQDLEAAVVGKLSKWIGNRACIVATHRPLILSKMTHVAVLQVGKMTIAGERDVVLKNITTARSDRQKTSAS